MRGEFNGLKTKILREQPCAFYVHCFAHQLQLALDVEAKKNIDVASFFTTANSLVNIVGASCKRRDALRVQYQDELVKAFDEGCLITGRGLNQDTTLKCAGITNTLSQALQKKDQDIVNAMGLVQTCKENLQLMRNNEFDELVDQASPFCNKHHIMVPNMDKEYVIPWRSWLNVQIKINNHHYRVKLFLHIIDGQLAELNDCFNEVNIELLTFATASVERAFSAMNIIKNPLRNRMGDQWLNDSLVVYIERDVFACIDNEAIMQRFQNMKTCRGQL
ncbi:uncharacterized protein LOC110755434 [Prunus avium]|uniref:Uncharacterized protein LOC110755434 n=1 Tax=Prunus avium TaxID=42229 RepID=A0A6P5S909_PRUAV|nr:uncharacterized protein LOC110755434 [Prunus avium]